MSELIRPTDQVVAVIADSITDDVMAVGSNLDEEWFRALVTRDVVVNNPNDSIFYRRYNRDPDTYNGFNKLATGLSTGRQFFINSAVAGSQTGFHMAGRFAKTFGWLPHVNQFLWAHGHNMSVTNAAIQAMTANRKYLRLGEICDAMDRVRAAFPTAAHMWIKPYPVGIPGDNRILPVVEAIDQCIALYGDMPVAPDWYTHFDGAGRPSGWYASDKVHPTATGVTEQYNVVYPVYDAWLLAQPTVIRPPLISGRGIAESESLLANPRFEFDANGALPGWTLNGTGTAVRDYAAPDTEMGDAYSLKVTRTSGDVYLSQTIDVTAFQGQTAPIVFAVRMNLTSPLTDLTAGRLQLTANDVGSAFLTAGNWIYDVNAKPVDGWRWAYHYCPPIPVGVTQVTLNIWAGSQATGHVNLGRATAVPGMLPRNLAN